ncbi:MAG TPA: ribonuclease III [Sedimentibacter sp.]|nr:ribonuclease III [Tissierellia bacterium]HAS90769.1 ribonuclease III [Clostridiales bacterium]HOA19616.1 ribonuclease III [Sedimentibacter sp.]HOG62428.1 ribonuclease III [Sedimentibacter sp.]HPB78879.1 ribonuclease III [Sedimentibacter sp.]
MITGTVYEFEKIIGYKFNNIKILEESLTHSSYSNEDKAYNKVNNERLEFLGDAVLSISVSRYIFDEFPDYPEGDLTKLRAQVVCEDTLSLVAANLNLGKYLLLGKGEESSGGRERKSILADAVEAVIAAIYLDGGYKQAEKFVLNNLTEYIKLAVKGKIITDFKSYLQEYYQSKSQSCKIRYVVTKEEGPDHDKVFHVNVMVNKNVAGKGVGKNKKIAEQNAAKDALIQEGCLNE